MKRLGPRLDKLERGRGDGAPAVLVVLDPGDGTDEEWAAVLDANRRERLGGVVFRWGRSVDATLAELRAGRPA